jgi:hypothetical protein
MSLKSKINLFLAGTLIASGCSSPSSEKLPPYPEYYTLGDYLAVQIHPLKKLMAYITSMLDCLTQ